MSDNYFDRGLVRLNGQLGGADSYTQVTCKEVSCTESLLTPGLQTSATFQSQTYKNDVFKNWDAIKNKPMTITMEDGYGNQMSLQQTVYRMDGREFHPVNISQVEEFTVHACDQSLLDDAKKLVSKYWKCTTPSKIVEEVLGTCLNIQNTYIQTAEPARDYAAEMIHPFQVIAQQANVALDGDDPSFVHYMTYSNRAQGANFMQGGSYWQPTHNFRSLTHLARQAPRYTFFHSETGLAGGADYNNEKYRTPNAFNRPAIQFMFPCDFDLLSDLLNGVDEQGQNINAGSFMNAMDMAAGFLTGGGGGRMQMCAPNGNFKQSLTNKGSAGQQNGCPSNVEQHLLKRQARMGLLEKDKVALRMIVAWNPYISVGDVISLTWKDKDRGQDLYGSGDYLVASLTHRVQKGGYATTTLDCVSNTVGQGIV